MNKFKKQLKLKIKNYVMIKCTKSYSHVAFINKTTQLKTWILLKCIFKIKLKTNQENFTCPQKFNLMMLIKKKSIVKRK